MKTKKEYLGDGVYMEGDGCGVWLTTDRNFPGNDPREIDRIYLEPAMVRKLADYMQGEDE